ncbi:MAG TPA: hypothetical protein VIT92_16665 [Burkholderiaceae bacterium]
MNEIVKQHLASIGIAIDDAALVGWTATNVHRAGELIGVVYTRGPEIHILPIVKTALTRFNICRYLAPLIEQYGYATTRVPIAETRHKLRLALGFVQTWADDKFTYWSLTQLPFTNPAQNKRTPSCQ